MKLYIVCCFCRKDYEKVDVNVPSKPIKIYDSFILKESEDKSKEDAKKVKASSKRGR
jgi:hypothetical protein